MNKYKTKINRAIPSDEEINQKKAQKTKHHYFCSYSNSYRIGFTS